MLKYVKSRIISIVGRRKFYIKLLLSTILLALLPTLFISIISYYNVSKAFEQKVSENNLQYLNQTINAMEIVITQIKESSQQLVLNQYFKDFENHPNGDYYEKLTGEISKTDLPGHYWYIQNKKKSIESIQNFLLSNPFVESVYYYDSYKEIVMTFDRDSYRQYTYDNFYDKAWNKTLESNKVSPLFMETRMVEQKDQSLKNMFTIIYRANKETNAFIINLDAEVINNNIIKKLNNKDYIYVLSSSGNIMFPFNQSNMNIEVEKFLNENIEMTSKTGSFVGEFINNNDVLVTHAQSPLLKWSFINISDLKQLVQGLTSLKQLILIFTLVLVVLIILLSLLLSHRLYRPIRKMKRTLKNKLEKVDDYKIDDEFLFMDNIIQTTFEQRDQFKEKYEESFPFLKERFKYSLVRKGSYAIEEINEKKQLLNVDIDSESLILFLLSLDDLQTLNVNQVNLYKIQIEEEMKNSQIINKKFFMIETDEDKLALVLNVTIEESKNIAVLGENLINYLTSKTKGTFTIGVSSFCKSILQLPVAYNEAIEALNFKILFGSGQVISIEDIVLDPGNYFVYPKEKIDMLSGFVKAGNAQKAKEVFQQIVSDIENSKKQLYYIQIQPIFVQILTNLINVVQSLGINIEVIYKNDPYYQLSELNAMDEFIHWFEQNIDDLSNYIQKEIGTKGNQHVSKVIQYLEENLAKDVSLNLIAEELKLNSAYVSRLFKQNTGKTFVEYLKELRIEKSKELLLQGNIKVNEVSKKVGYQNTYYFIKLFKESTGTTPGEYKKIVG